MDDIEFLYESILITEMDDRVINYIEQNKQDLLPFDNIFGDKMRLVIPMVGSEVLNDLLVDIRSINGFLGFDKNTQEVVRKIKLDPKYGQGDEKEQRINMGKAIQGLKISEDLKKKYLNWYAKYKDSMKDMDVLGQYVIVLSRSPIDIVRMSDHRNISSCHSRGNSHFQCAIEEAINGGGVAYLVYKDSLDGLSDSDLQEDDLFSDSDRSIRGVEPPLARLRLRNVKGDRLDIAVPELRSYGRTDIPGFYQSIVEFLKTKQSVKPSDFKNNYQYVAGGSYEDNKMFELINSYLDLGEDDKFDDELDISPDSDADYRETQHLKLGKDLEKELQDIMDSFSYDENISVWFNVDDSDNDEYYMMSAEVNFDLSNYNLPEDFSIEIDDNYQLSKSYKDEKYGAFSKQLYDAIDKYDLYLGRIEADAEDLKLVLYHDRYRDTQSDSDEFYSFCDDLKTLDLNWTDVEFEIEQALIDSNLVEGGADEYSRIKEYFDTDESDLPWTNIRIIGSKFSDYEVLLTKLRAFDSASIVLVRLLPEIIANIRMSAFNQSFTNDVRSAFWKFSLENFKPKIHNDDDQLKFASFFEAYTTQTWIGDVQFKDFDIKVLANSDANYTHPNTIMLSRLSITPSKWSNTTMEYFDFIDNNHSILINLVRYLTINRLIYSLGDNLAFDDENVSLGEQLKNSISNYSNLDRVFRKYL